MDNTTTEMNYPNDLILDFFSRVTEDDIEQVMHAVWKGKRCDDVLVGQAQRAIPAIAEKKMTAVGHEMKTVLGNFLARLDLSTFEKIVKRKGDLSPDAIESMYTDVFYYYTLLKPVIGV